MNEPTVSPFLDELPLGITKDGAWSRHYVLRELTAADSRRIREDTLIRQRPVEWMAHVLGLSLESLCEEPIYEEYKKSMFKMPPALLRKLPMTDVTYLLAASHVHTFGPIVNDMRMLCSSCRQYTNLTVDLNELQVTRASSFMDSVTVKLDKGFKYSGELQYLTGRVWDTYTLRVPTLDDYILFQDKFVKSSVGSDLNTSVLRRCLLRVQDSAGEDMPTENVQMFGTRLMDEITGSDYNKIVASFNGLPGLDRRVDFVCSSPSCRVQSTGGVDYGFFFPRG